MRLNFENSKLQQDNSALIKVCVFACVCHVYIRARMPKGLRHISTSHICMRALTVCVCVCLCVCVCVWICQTCVNQENEVLQNEVGRVKEHSLFLTKNNRCVSYTYAIVHTHTHTYPPPPNAPIGPESINVLNDDQTKQQSSRVLQD
jgi:hypothetical protein